MTTESQPLRSLENRSDSIRWDPDSPLSMTVNTRQGDIVTRLGRFVGGRSDGVEIVEIDTGAAIVRVLPSRGMGIWEIEVGGTRFGWRSPVEGPVHPEHVPVFDPSGLGWLEGFDELVARCGLESNGAPQHNDAGHLVYPLHGRIANLPADSLSIEFDEASGRLDLIGEMLESRLFFKRFRLRTRIRMHAGSTRVDLLDDVTNELDKAATAQMLYHINVGPPVLGEGATLDAPIVELAGKDDLSAGEIEHWNQFGPPTAGYGERVYFSQLQADDNGHTTAMLCSADRDKALAVDFATKTLPYFVTWKNTASENDGYVTGLEPATNLPNTREFETGHGRVVTLEPGECVSFRLSLIPMTDAAKIEKVSDAIERLREGIDTTVHQEPKPGWSA
ncbi:aldose 1-epimerase family protein [Crateriforma conspicua]|uniref:DUF4432 domain-containing protein n=1 Tax=Crateriforma conspicua TaxID=2527996 RepID=A0A5C5XR57_9PLAN|nr:aldose 1-epimerase family protein [Crateriforma conspicua]QDV66300.1 hypothetical protein Mal65_54760 [Crateriforma conspicua]TWT65706.1 hypothetical protein Pan14r_52550 [Crateriforma conspicua]